MNWDILRYHPDYNKKFILGTDASKSGVGTILYLLSTDREFIDIESSPTTCLLPIGGG